MALKLKVKFVTFVLGVLGRFLTELAAIPATIGAAVFYSDDFFGATGNATYYEINGAMLEHYRSVLEPAPAALPVLLPRRGAAARVQPVTPAAAARAALAANGG